LGIPNGHALTITNPYVLTNDGVIIIENGGTINGTILGNQPEEPSFTVTGDSSYSNAGILTITGDGNYTIGMRSGITNTVTNRIVVAPDVNADITLSNIDIYAVTDSALYMTGATVRLTLVGENVLRGGRIWSGIEVPSGATLVVTEDSIGSLTAIGGEGAGIGISNFYITDFSTGGNINILGGTITAIGGHFGAGIGGGYYGAGCIVNITGGTVTATGGYYGAGIGGGAQGSGGTINITGGTITAIGGTSATGIGGGQSGASGTIETISGNAIIFASSIQPELPTGANLGSAIIFNGNNGTMYGDVALQQDVAFPVGRILPISSAQSLTVPAGITLTNNGTINNEGTIYRYGIINGTGSITGNQPVE